MANFGNQGEERDKRGVRPFDAVEIDLDRWWMPTPKTKEGSAGE